MSIFVDDKLFLQKSMSTQQRIVAKALELFNEKGIEYVGMRELAAALDTKLGNITYYFPTKEDLILQVTMDLSEANAAILQEDEKMTIQSYLQMSQRHYECQYQYRCIFLSFVHLRKQYEKLSDIYRRGEDLRRKTVLKNLGYLTQNKYLRELTASESTFLTSAILLLSRFWISEAAISYGNLKPAEQIRHYIGILANILSPYCSAKGKGQLAEFLDG